MSNQRLGAHSGVNEANSQLSSQSQHDGEIAGRRRPSSHDQGQAIYHTFNPVREPISGDVECLVLPGGTHPGSFPDHDRLEGSGSQRLGRKPMAPLPKRSVETQTPDTTDCEIGDLHTYSAHAPANISMQDQHPSARMFVPQYSENGNEVFGHEKRNQRQSTHHNPRMIAGNTDESHFGNKYNGHDRIMLVQPNEHDKHPLGSPRKSEYAEIEEDVVLPFRGDGTARDISHRESANPHVQSLSHASREGRDVRAERNMEHGFMTPRNGLEAGTSHTRATDRSSSSSSAHDSVGHTHAHARLSEPDFIRKHHQQRQVPMGDNPRRIHPETPHARQEWSGTGRLKSIKPLPPLVNKSTGAAPGPPDTRSTKMSHDSGRTSKDECNKARLRRLHQTDKNAWLRDRDTVSKTMERTNMVSTLLSFTVMIISIAQSELIFQGVEPLSDTMNALKWSCLVLSVLAILCLVRYYCLKILFQRIVLHLRRGRKLDVRVPVYLALTKVGFWIEVSYCLGAPEPHPPDGSSVPLFHFFLCNADVQCRGWAAHAWLHLCE
jgi:hypothetical protein